MRARGSSHHPHHAPHPHHGTHMTRCTMPPPSSMLSSVPELLHSGEGSIASGRFHLCSVILVPAVCRAWGAGAFDKDARPGFLPDGEGTGIVQQVCRLLHVYY